MEFKRFLTCFSLMFLLVASPRGWTQFRSELEKGLAAVQDVERELSVEADPTPPLVMAFDRFFGSVSVEDLNDLSDADLKAFLSAADTLAFYTFDNSYLDRVEAAFNAIESRGLQTPFEVQTLFKDYVKIREVERARVLANRYADVELEPLPRLVNASTAFEGPTVLELVGN